MTKVLFVVVFYSALIPSAFFFGAAILIVQYFSDKYCLTVRHLWTTIKMVPLGGVCLTQSSLSVSGHRRHL
jgi:hypothetical protein